MAAPLASQKGQAVVEYVLILIVAVTVATMLVQGLVYRSPDAPGIITSKWQQIVEAIGQDLPD